ncbi:MAG: 4Fe-4S dicluster domain-containing protein [Desulfuromonadaceae bacterium]|nr:4Fe-4S dicluster domain-containing protein [Desulfuromonadaceae bacterium]MDD2848828.1 4Fe-4S dicluster domain-containing protein [Desulfuromonadaceae bacterium]MDD4132215.1 4Fe-4S dicluster domain-containing protein [Desulfuromonadaceae bacterium]
MATQFIANHNLAPLLVRLRQSAELHGPVRGDDGVVRFAAIAPGTLPDLSAVRTLLPPKKYLLHPQETILKYTVRAGYQMPVEDVHQIILFGLHPCDLAGINYLDRIFLDDEPDPLYVARRSVLALVGVSCSPDEFCSCHQLTSPLKALFDLFFNVVEGGFVVTSGSARGDELLEKVKDLLEERVVAVPEDARRFFGHAAAEATRPEPDATLPEWRELASRCLGCGACSICCPTCYCFDVLEFCGLDNCSASRVRQWDNCLFKGHAEVAGGMTFRKDKAERFRYRYRHKYRGFGLSQGIPSCVGCGRCRAVCPAGLDLRPLAERLEGGQRE